MLSHPGIKAGLTHCGMGGTLEFISMGVPAVLFPHFADQHWNAANLRNADAGLTLWDQRRRTTDIKERFSYVSPRFDSKHVENIFKKVLND